MNNPDEVPLASFKLDLSSSSCGVPFCMPGTQVENIFFMLFLKRCSILFTFYIIAKVCASEFFSKLTKFDWN